MLNSALNRRNCYMVAIIVPFRIGSIYLVTLWLTDLRKTWQISGKWSIVKIEKSLFYREPMHVQQGRLHLRICFTIQRLSLWVVIVKQTISNRKAVGDEDKDRQYYRQTQTKKFKLWNLSSRVVGMWVCTVDILERQYFIQLIEGSSNIITHNYSSETKTIIYSESMFNP